MSTAYGGLSRPAQRPRLYAHNSHSEGTSKEFMGCASSLVNTHQDSKKRRQLAKRMLVVQGIIGTGGFGKVLAVTLQQTGKWYAVKEINKVDLLKHKSGHSMISSELDSMSKVGEHPFIISLQLAYHDRLNCYFVLDLKTGGDLRYYLRSRMIFEERDVAFYVACISSALNHIHSRNMLHRDIKPENIILDERGWPHLADFGVAHVHTAANSAKFGGTLTSTLASGTKQYLAPEVFCKEHIHGPESDYWALAVVAYELLHAKRPFEKHCSINFINYLERGLAARREQLKKEKMRRLFRPRELSVSSDANELGVFMPVTGSPRRAFCSSATCSNYSPSASASTSRESSAYFPGVTGSRSGSIDDTDGAATGGYCSSANVTPAHTPQRKGAAEKYALKEGSPRRCAQCDSHASSSVEEGSELDYSSETTAHLDLGRMKLNKPQLSVHVPRSPSRTDSTGSTGSGSGSGSGRSSGFDSDASTPKHVGNLPQLSPSSTCSAFSPHTPHTPHTPHRARSAKNKDNLYLPPANSATSPAPLKALLQESSERHPLAASGANADHTLTRVFQRAPYGDHWAVDDDEHLPSDLRVSLPQSNVWLGPLSHECISFLKGMFDIRPSHRLSSRDITEIRTHPWLQIHDLENWDDLHHHRFNPNFRPGKRFMREIFADPTNVMLMGAGNVLNDPDDDWTRDNSYLPNRQPRSTDDSADGTGGVLTAEQRASFRGFRYTSESLKGIFRNEEPELPSNSILKTGSSTASSSPTYAQY